eukprot:1177961-Rhodomonas_salina.1
MTCDNVIETCDNVGITCDGVVGQVFEVESGEGKESPEAEEENDEEEGDEVTALLSSHAFPMRCPALP